MRAAGSWASGNTGNIARRAAPPLFVDLETPQKDYEP